MLIFKILVLFIHPLLARDYLLLFIFQVIFSFTIQSWLVSFATFTIRLTISINLLQVITLFMLLPLVVIFLVILIIFITFTITLLIFKPLGHRCFRLLPLLLPFLHLLNQSLHFYLHHDLIFLTFISLWVVRLSALSSVILRLFSQLLLPSIISWRLSLFSSFTFRPHSFVN